MDDQSSEFLFARLTNISEECPTFALAVQICF